MTNAKMVAADRRRVRRIMFVLMMSILPWAPASLQAQEIVAQGAFVDFRYASRSPIGLFSGVSVSGSLVLIGMLQDPTTEYREMIGGIGRTLHWGNSSLTGVVAGAHASDGWYGQLYLMPAIHHGQVAISGVLVMYEPLESTAVRQFYANPLSISLRILSRFDIGLSGTMSKQTGPVGIDRLGPMVRATTNGILVELTALKPLQAAGAEFRVGMRVGF